MAQHTGKVLTGYCGGHFGRDSYEDKTIVEHGHYRGRVWLVVWDESFSGGLLNTATMSQEEFDRLIAEDLSSWE